MDLIEFGRFSPFQELNSSFGLAPRKDLLTRELCHEQTLIPFSFRAPYPSKPWSTLYERLPCGHKLLGISFFKTSQKACSQLTVKWLNPRELFFLFLFFVFFFSRVKWKKGLSGLVTTLVPIKLCITSWHWTILALMSDTNETCYYLNLQLLNLQM